MDWWIGRPPTQGLLVACLVTGNQHLEWGFFVEGVRVRERVGRDGEVEGGPQLPYIYFSGVKKTSCSWGGSPSPKRTCGDL